MNRNRNRIVTVMVPLALAAVGLLLSRSDLSSGGERLEVLKITILKVGRADAIVVQAESETLVIDAGEDEDGKEVAKFLTDQGVHTVNTLIITHFDKDHVDVLMVRAEENWNDSRRQLIC